MVASLFLRLRLSSLSSRGVAAFGRLEFADAPGRRVVGTGVEMTENDMTPEMDLGALLRGLSPRLDPRLFVFASLREISPEILADEPLCLFREAEGWTVIIEESKAARYGAEDALRFSMITLEVYSDLEAVGLTAVATTALAAYGIPANVIAGYHHDHIFTPADDAEDAIDALLEMSEVIEDL